MKYLFIRASHQAGFDTKSFYSGDLEDGEVEQLDNAGHRNTSELC